MPILWKELFFLDTHQRFLKVNKMNACANFDHHPFCLKLWRRVLTHQTILARVWGPEYGQESEYLWAYIRRLRKKLEPDQEQPTYIFTDPGVGYRFRGE